MPGFSRAGKQPRSESPGGSGGIPSTSRANAVDALADRLADLEPKVLVTQDGSWRHGVILPLKARSDEAIPAAAGVEQTIVVRRTGIDVAWYEGDRWYDELVAGPRPGTTAAS